MDFFEIVDDDDQVIGLRPRSECHGNPDLVHRVSHVLVFNSAGNLLLQKRSLLKDVQPGKWDTSVGGHVDPGENYLQAAYREMEEELGVTGQPLKVLYPSKIRNNFESENVMTYLVVYDGKICFNRTEIDEIRFWTPSEIDQALGSGILTPNFEEEWQLWLDYSASPAP
nr:NUDIX domain-containing protein [uncultured Desulfuromonas sp.]